MSRKAKGILAYIIIETVATVAFVAGWYLPAFLLMICCSTILCLACDFGRKP